MLTRTIISAIAMAATAAITIAPGTATASNTAPPDPTASHGCYTQTGIHTQKQSILDAGGNSLDMAVAMEENSSMTIKYPFGDNKTRDSANFGLFKQNWYMIRTSAGQYSSYGPTQFQVGAALNTDRPLDIKVLHLSQAKYGTYQWFAGQRGGQSGLSKPATTDINTYRNAIYWIQAQMTAHPSYLTDDTHCWVMVQAI